MFDTERRCRERREVECDLTDSAVTRECLHRFGQSLPDPIGPGQTMLDRELRQVGVCINAKFFPEHRLVVFNGLSTQTQLKRDFFDRLA